VQWLAAVESPPHLVCAFPAMCFSSGRQFFYFGGAFDLSWLSWTVENIAAEDRRRRGVATGPQTIAKPASGGASTARGAGAGAAS
jgi:predicted acyl esterase